MDLRCATRSSSLQRYVIGHGRPSSGPAASKYAQTLRRTCGAMKWTCTSMMPGSPRRSSRAGMSSSRMSHALEAAAHLPLDVALGLAFGDRVALVVLLLAAGE